MNNLKNIIAVVGCAVIAFVAYNFWIGGGYFLGLTEPKPDPSGNLSAGAVSTANFLASALEIVAWLATTIIGTVIAAATGGYRFLAREIGGLLGKEVEEPPNVVARKRPTNRRMSPQMLGQMQQLLMQSAIDGDKAMVMAIAEKIHGKRFLTKPTAKSVEPAEEAEPEGGES